MAWSELTRDAFEPGYWNALRGWYADGGIRNVAAYLKALDLGEFDPKAPPPRTTAFYDIVDANRAPEDAEVADALEALKNPEAVTLSDFRVVATDSFLEWLDDRRNRRQIPHRLEAVGYVSVRNPSAKDGLWVIDSWRQSIYVRADLPARERHAAAMRIAKGER